MRWRRTLIWLACWILPLVILWVVLLARPRDRSAERATAQTVAAQLEGSLAAQAAVVMELAERFSHWETLPPPAVLDALRATATRHLALRQLLVADAAGRLVAGYDSDQPPGREGLASGSLDSVLGRRAALRTSHLVVTSRSKAGTVERLELAAPIRSTDGTRHGYVGASVSLRDTRRLLRELTAKGLDIVVADKQGALIFPCRGAAPTGGTTIRSGQFSVTVEKRSSHRPWTPVLASAGVLLLLLLGLGLLRSLDRRP